MKMHKSKGLCVTQQSKNYSCCLGDGMLYIVIQQPLKMTCVYTSMLLLQLTH